MTTDESEPLWASNALCDRKGSKHVANPHAPVLVLLFVSAYLVTSPGSSAGGAPTF